MPPPSSVEIGPGRLLHENNDKDFQRSKFSRTLIKSLIFAIVFLLSAAVSLSYNYMRPAIYESRADLLLSPDFTGSIVDVNSGAAIQDIAVQSQILLSRDLLAEVLAELSNNNENNEAIPADLPNLKNMIQVTQVENSTIVNLRAEGPDKEVLPVIVNTWLDIYLEKNSQTQILKSNAEWESIQGQISELAAKLTEKQDELDVFRDKYDIVSMQRDENQALSELKGLNATLNNAIEKKVTAEANLAAIREAIDNDKWAGNSRKPGELVSLERQADTLREKVDEYEARYTPKYLAIDKDARAVIEKLERLEEKILLLYEENRKSAIEEAEQEIISAEHVVREIEDKLAANKKKTTLFSKRFSEYESLQEELSQLEDFSRDLKEKQVAMEIKSATDIIKVKVLERAFVIDRPIRPNYLRDAILGVSLSLLLGILSVMFFELLTKPARAWSESHPQSITYNQLIPNTHPFLTVISGKNQSDHAAIPALEQKLPRELAETEVQAMMDASDEHVQLLIAALLNGLSLEEAARLKWGDIDWKSKNINVPGENARTLVTVELFLQILERNMPGEPNADLPILKDKSGSPLSTRELESFIAKAAAEAGLDQPTEITSQACATPTFLFLCVRGAT